MKNTTRIVLVAAALVQCLVMVSAATHTVGGSFGWDLPSINTFYNDWASSQTFVVGDTLVFNFTDGRHDVVEVPKSGYDSCSSANEPQIILTGSPRRITLTAAGDRYFFCGFPGHCSLGQKMAISVVSTADPAASPTGTVPGAAASLTSGGRIAAVSAVVLSLASYFLL